MRIAASLVVLSLGLTALLGVLIASKDPSENASSQAAPIRDQRIIGSSVEAVIDPVESHQFAKDIEEMRNQLDSLTESPPLSPPGITIPMNSNDVQLLFQRLERLQQSHFDESHLSEEEK